MAFPDTPLDIQVDLEIDGQWQDITADVLTRDPMTIVRGRPDEGARTDPGKLKLLLNNGRSNVNPDVMGRYSDGNPRSDLFGKIGRNTPVRVHLPAPESYLQLDGDPTGTVSTPHAAALNITGDIDVRVEFDSDLTDVSLNQSIIGKWGSLTADRSWLLRIYDGFIYLNWLDAATQVLGSWITVERFGGRALRVTLDVNNGAGGITAGFYQADSLDGPWVQFAEFTSTSGTTDIQSTTSPLTIGVYDGLPNPAIRSIVGTVTRAQVRSGIDGTIVADADFRGLAEGATSFTDSAGRAWTVNGTAEVRKRADRIVAEISSWPPRWDVSGEDRWVPVEAAGVLRRYGQGTDPLQSALRRRIPSFNPLAYWPMEDGARSSQASSPIEGVRPMALSNVNWAANDSLVSSDSLPVWASSSGANPVVMQGVVPPPAAATTGWQVAWIYRLDSVPTTLRTIMRIDATGTVRQWQVQAKDNLSRVVGTDVNGSAVFDQNIATSNDLFNTWVASHLRVSESGGTVTWTVSWSDIHGNTGVFSSTFSGTVGVVTAVGSPPGGYHADLDGLSLGHVAAFSTTTTAAYTSALDGWTPEAAGRRIVRLGTEENIPVSMRGIVSEQTTMGSQLMLSLLDLLGEAADSDGGILMEHRARLALRYRGRATLYNQAPALVLDYTAEGEVAPPLEPVTDDADMVNDVTVTRIDGSSAQVALTDGALSVQPPPNGIGRYSSTVQRSLAEDAHAASVAGWLLHLGTMGGDSTPRYPVVHVDLFAAPHLIDTVLGVDQGDLIRITDPPEDVPPGDIDLIVQGYTEAFDQFAWDIYFTCTPAGPWRVAERAVYEDFEDTVFALGYASGGNAAWTRSTSHFNSGTTALRSGVIGNNQTSDAIFTIPPGSTRLEFWYWTSSEASGPGFLGDRLQVIVDGVTVLTAQGTTPWTQAILDVTGKSTVTFRYAKDNSATSGEDAVYIDDLTFTTLAPARRDTAGSELASTVTSTATSFSVATTLGPVWTQDPVHLPFDVRLGGEVVRVTTVTGTNSPQTFAVVRSVNGISKAHDAGTPIRLAEPAVRAL
ncbi:hypothetical protein [Streptomyces antibioticus]|uniref:hypothetical protein n=1 Tax=Streptomyces antibioticus TaxID=1890 RepID=UPI003691147D